MTATLSHDTPAVFQLATPETWRNPWPMYRALRDHDPVHHVVPDNPDHDYYVLSRHADIFTAARNPSMRSTTYSRTFGSTAST